MLSLLFLYSIPLQKVEERRAFFALEKRITNILHIPAFGILFFLWFKAFKRLQISWRNCYLLAFTVSILYGVFLEIYQLLIPGRFSSFRDILFNLSGTAIAALIITWKR